MEYKIRLKSVGGGCDEKLQKILNEKEIRNKRNVWKNQCKHMREKEQNSNELKIERKITLKWKKWNEKEYKTEIVETKQRMNERKKKKI